MYASKYRKDLDLMHFPGRIPFIQHLWWCIRQYCIQYAEPDPWELVEETWHEEEAWYDEETWGHYDDETREWVQL